MKSKKKKRKKKEIMGGVKTVKKRDYIDMGVGDRDRKKRKVIK